jgi:hypothetical protein
VNRPLVASRAACCHPSGVKPRSLLWLVPALTLVSGCNLVTKKPKSAATVTVEPEATSDAWKRIATAADQDRLLRLGLAWQAALTEANERRAKEVSAEGELLKPRSGLARPQPTPGSYNCRMISLGRKGDKPPAIEKFKPFFCYVLSDDDGVLTIVKQTGSRRPAGRLWDDDDPRRMIFLGSLALGDEKEPLAYGEDTERDTAGVFERIGPFKWRLVIPWPRSGAKLEVFELTPVADQPEG